MFGPPNGVCRTTVFDVKQNSFRFHKEPPMRHQLLVLFFTSVKTSLIVQPCVHNNVPSLLHFFLQSSAHHSNLPLYALCFSTLAQRSANHTWKAPSSMYVTDHNNFNLSTPLSSLSLRVFNQNVTGELACLWVASGGAQNSQQPSAPSPHNYFHNKQHHALGYTAARQEEIRKTELTNQARVQSASVSPYILLDTASIFDIIWTFSQWLFSWAPPISW